jgi:hypothetical protein
MPVMRAGGGGPVLFAVWRDPYGDVDTSASRAWADY